MERARSSYRDADWGIDASLAGFVVATFLVCLGGPDLIGPDEGRHASIAREMVERGEYLVPTLHCRPYFDKPVLLNWLIVMATSVFGRVAAAVRTPSALAAIALVFATVRWARVQHGVAASRITALLLPTSLLVFTVGRTAIIDMLLCALMSAALWRLGSWFEARSHERPSLLPAYALLALGCLAKGPIALLLPALIFLAMVVVLRKPRLLLEARPFAGAAVVLAVAGPWYLSAWLHSPEYIETFLFHHNVSRYMTTGAVGHQQGWWYYPLLFPLALLPWGFALFPALLRRAKPMRPANLFPLVWAAVVIAFFAPAKAKLITYLLPAIPPLCVVTAAWLARCFEDRRELPHVMALWSAGWSVVLALGLAAVTIWVVTLQPVLAVWLPSLFLSGLVLIVQQRFRAEHTVVRWLATVVVGHLALLTFVLGPGAGFYNVGLSERGLAEALEAHVERPAKARSFGKQASAASWYAGYEIPRLYDLAELDSLLDEGLDALLVRPKFLPQLAPWFEAGRLQLVWVNDWGSETLLLVRPAATEAQP